jgi:hypothetical protein
VEPFAPLSGPDRAGLIEEGGWLLEFAAAGAASHDVRFVR